MTSDDKSKEVGEAIGDELTDRPLTPEEEAALEHDPLRSAIQRVESEEPELSDEKSEEVLRGIQRKLRQRSRGKFYGDGWSTSNARFHYLTLAIVMLVITALSWVVLSPSAFR